MTEPSKIVPFAWKDRPALIESLLPVQKLSAESFKEQMAGSGKTLTSLGSYWKGRKPLILNKACILGCLLPVSENPLKDMQIFEMLMGMDQESLAVRQKPRPTPKTILGILTLENLNEFFVGIPIGLLPKTSPINWADPDFKKIKVKWAPDISECKKRELEIKLLTTISYKEKIGEALRAEDTPNINDHIWDKVNAHLGTNAKTTPDLVKQLGILRFGHTPKIADPFSGSGQIAFEAARLGCDVTASDINPIACMLSWGALNLVGGDSNTETNFYRDQSELVKNVYKDLKDFNIEESRVGLKEKALLYCVEIKCPVTGWAVPVLPSLIVSEKNRVVAELLPDPLTQTYEIKIINNATGSQIAKAKTGTITRDSRYGKAYLEHHGAGIKVRIPVNTLKGAATSTNGEAFSLIKPWRFGQLTAQEENLFKERLYCIQWVKVNPDFSYGETSYLGPTLADLDKEKRIEQLVHDNFKSWVADGIIPDMRIEVGGPPRYQGQDLIKNRGWVFWHHAFTPRQLLVNGLIKKHANESTYLTFARTLNCNSKLSRWDSTTEYVQGAFDNQALNVLYNYATRGTVNATHFFEKKIKFSPCTGKKKVLQQTASTIDFKADIFITDPPYGDAVKYEEILDYFIAWLRPMAPKEFANWIWDGRRPLAIKGEDEKFRQDMVAAYKRMTECMPDNGIQVIMFTHQSEKIWADLATIVWASGLQVTAAWYVVTETDSVLRGGSNVKGTVLLACRKRTDQISTFRDDLAYELKDEVKKQIEMLTGLNQQVTAETRDENPFGDADLQMAGYAAALRVLTKYTVIDGKNMPEEALRPRVKNESSMVAELIEFAVSLANRALVPTGVTQDHWNELKSAERFYLKMLEMEAKGTKTLDNYQNFAKAFGVGDFKSILASKKANQARLKSAVELGKTEMGDGSELADTSLRAVLYALWELQKDVDGDEVLTHLSHNLSDFYQQEKRVMVSALSEFLANTLIELRPEEASAARVLAELVRNQQM